MKAQNRIWLIGGTQESADLAQALTQQQISYVVSVTTESARSLYTDGPFGCVWVDRLTAASLPQFLQQYNIVAVLDASHPFAVEISQLVIATCKHQQIPYLRYERPHCNPESQLSLVIRHSSTSTTRYWTPASRKSTDPGQSNIQHPTSNITSPLILDSFKSLLSSHYLTGQRVFLTTGYRSLERFKPWQDQAVLFARILPSMTALEAAIAAGFTPDRIVALRPPISADLERALWQQWQISMVVTKASGPAGGEDVKRQVAAELGVQLVVIARPEIAYPEQTSDLSVALRFCQSFCT
ncbi:precorrin-6A reductase [Leptodesmis sichuanensis]|uniref:precorrin-6A reductase n=1 Tax=Leptodesmis sichuanensis TaxID=2906798 RepID=UPI001F007032|nr:precorrin-6A reductase [Leptodesmis sichuanensis]UIE36324.1 precorrin-6A reductase [Leptodesmis sichuanensis A121]